MHRRYTRFHARVEALADYLTAEGVLTDPVWREAMHEVPRDLFVPDKAYAASFLPDASSRVIDQKKDRGGWWDAIYRNFSIVTQRADGSADVTDTDAEPTCSLSCPHVAITYLELLDLQDHHRVLEIGTGTGWTAGMLAWRQRSSRVTTIEVDEDIARRARSNLESAQLRPEVVTGDGAKGYAAAAPYDRIHVTCGVREIPTAWLEQARPGGVIVVPYMPVAGGYGHQLRLDVTAPGRAIGRFTGGGGFMMLRAQRPPTPQARTEGGTRSTTRLDPRLIAEADGGAQLMLAALVPGLAVDTRRVETGDGWASLVEMTDLAGSSWATCTAPQGAEDYEVYQGGDRHLWDEASAAYLAWLKMGRPDRGRFGMSITGGEQVLWLDNPDNVLAG